MAIRTWFKIVATFESYLLLLNLNQQHGVRSLFCHCFK
jgi:hypothetical protein